jgi:hypothetical protein
MTTIGIVGAGIAGMHLALYLQKHGVEATLYSDRSPDAIRAGRLPNTVALMGATQARHRALGVDHWDEPGQTTGEVTLRFAGAPPLYVHGSPSPPWLYVDMRLYLPRLMEDFASRGGKIVVSPCGAGDVAGLGTAHDLVVVATGRAGLAEMFPRLPERSPYEAPQRRLVTGLYRGIRSPQPFRFHFNVAPGEGEIFEAQFLTFSGIVGVVFIEAIPGGAFEPVTHLRYEDDPDAFNGAVLSILRDYAPDTYARTDPAAFGLLGPLDTLSGAVVPTARRGWTSLPGGRFAMAVGDAYITHDPVIGQGANAASRAAWLLGETVTAHARAGRPFDEAFCRETERRLWEQERAVTEWNNAFLQPPPPHAVELLVAASQNKAIADAFVSNFNHPQRQWEVLSSPAATAAFVAGFGAPAAP